MARVAIWARERPDFIAVAEGVERLGWEPFFQRAAGFRVGEDAAPCDVAILQSRKGEYVPVAECYEARGVPVLVVDLPPLRLERFHGWRAMWPGEVNRLPLPDYARAGSLGLGIQGDAETSDELLLCGQTPGDAAHGLDASALADWYESSVATIRRVAPHLRITWRPHPGWLRSLDGTDALEHPEELPLERGLARPLAAIVSYNSTCGVAALLAGHRVLCDRQSFYRFAAQGGPEDAAAPGERNHVAIRELVARCAAVQWSPAELRTGEPIRQTLQRLEEAA